MRTACSLAFATVILAPLALAADAHAGTGLEVEAILGVNGEVEADQMSCKSGCTGTQALDEEDLEGNFGVAATYERAVRPQLRIGGRASYLAGEGDSSEQELSTIGGGVWARYLFPVSTDKVTLHLAADLGPTYMMTEAMVLGVKMDFAGVGFHALVGAGVSAKIADGLEFRGGVYYSYESVGSIEADESGVVIEVEDMVATRVLITAGLGF